MSSNNHGAVIDHTAAFADLAARGGGATPFWIEKIIQGTGYTNPFGPSDLAAARAAGFALAGYLMDQGNADPAAEEALYRRLVGSLPQTDDDELPEGLSTPEYIAHLTALIAQDPAAIVYLNQSEVRSGYHVGAGLWLAEYNRQPGVVSFGCLMHQYDDAGSVAGIKGDVDLNAWLGTEDQFFNFFAPNVRPPSYKSRSLLLTGSST